MKSINRKHTLTRAHRQFRCLRAHANYKRIRNSCTRKVKLIGFISEHLHAIRMNCSVQMCGSGRMFLLHHVMRNGNVLPFYQNLFILMRYTSLHYKIEHPYSIISIKIQSKLSVCLNFDRVMVCVCITG